MDNMKILEDKNNIIIENITDFDLMQTLECGQCFRFYKESDEEYVIVAYNRLLHIKQETDRLIFFDCDRDTVEKIWIPYFDLERDYGAIKEYLLEKDNKLKEAIKEKNGVRILNQEFHETLISFIISQNKNIPQIKQIVERMCEHYGEYLGDVNGKSYYTFPDEAKLGTLTEEDFREMRTGFRAPYLYDASQKLFRGEITADTLQGLSEEETRTKLLEIKGVGDKVANCVMLFSLGFRAAFPIDVWIKRIMEAVYFEGEDTPKDKIKEFAVERFAEYGGYAQQYLFYFGKENKLGVKKM